MSTPPPINDEAERKHYTINKCCGNCKRRQILKKLHKFQDEDSYCPLHKKKFKASDKENGAKCGDFVPFMTPEEVKEETLRFRRILNIKSKKQLGRERQELCRKIQKNKQMKQQEDSESEENR